MGVPPCGTDTDDTDDDHRIGGLGLLSHSKISLTHQHWIMQLICSGGFNVHCTQGSEASHKSNMRLASLRVQHRRQPVTEQNMTKYLQNKLLFDELQTLRKIMTPGRASKRRKYFRRSGVFQPLRCPVTGKNLDMGDNLQSPSRQRLFLHSRVRLTNVELLDMFCEKLEVPATQQSYVAFNSLSWTFGEKLSLADGPTYWATDQSYLGGTNTHSKRRDVFILSGTESVKSPNGTKIDNALCCQAVCFITIKNLNSLRRYFSLRSLAGEIDVISGNGSMTYVLGRWLTPHSTCVERDSKCLPMCPGVLRRNHCLWKYASTNTPRRMMVDSRGRPSHAFVHSGDIFGKDKMKLWQSEKKCYFGLISPKSIVTTANISREYEESSMNCSDIWLQTVTNV